MNALGIGPGKPMTLTEKVLFGAVVFCLIYIFSALMYHIEAYLEPIMKAHPILFGVLQIVLMFVVIMMLLGLVAVLATQ